MIRLSVFIANLFVFPSVLAAQHRGATPAPGHAAVSAPRAGARAVPAPPPRSGMRVQPPATRSAAVGFVPRTHSPGRRPAHHNNFVSSHSLGATDFQDVPGLGFDFPHLPATTGNRHAHRRNFDNTFPLGFSGFLLGAPSVIVEEAQPESQSELQQSDPEDALAENARESEAVRLGRSRSRRAENVPASRDSISRENEEPAPQKNVAQFVFVKRDGSLIFAVGYSWDTKQTLRYVTPDGLRRSIAREALDLHATEEFNEQRGLNFTFPA